MSQDTLYIITVPGESPIHPAPHRIPVHLTYRIRPNLTLLRLQGPASRGGVMAVSGESTPCGNPELLCRALLRECAARQFRGLLLDFDRLSPDLTRLAGLLSGILPKYGITLFLPECLAPHASGCRVLIPCALSGGSLEQRLQDAVAQFGADRVVLALERTSEDFTLPAPTGCGQPLTPAQLETLCRDLRPKIHFSVPLCTRYFTYCRDTKIHLVLCDDDDCLLQKTALARRCGIFRFLLLQRDKQAVFPDFSPQ